MPQLKFCHHVTSIKLAYMCRIIFTKYFNPFSKPIYKYKFFPLCITCFWTPPEPLRPVGPQKWLPT